jgi:hypothetical protein
MQMVCDLFEVGTEFMYAYTDKFNDFHSLKGYEIKCVINMLMNPLKTTRAPTTNIT